MITTHERLRGIAENALGVLSEHMGCTVGSPEVFEEVGLTPSDHNLVYCRPEDIVIAERLWRGRDIQALLADMGYDDNDENLQKTLNAIDLHRITLIGQDDALSYVKDAITELEGELKEI